MRYGIVFKDDATSMQIGNFIRYLRSALQGEYKILHYSMYEEGSKVILELRNDEVSDAELQTKIDDGAYPFIHSIEVVR